MPVPSILPGRKEDQRRTSNRRQTFSWDPTSDSIMSLKKFPRGGVQVRETGGVLDKPSVASALKSITDNPRKKEM